MDQFGLGADVLLELNPRLLMVRMPAFGLTGPWRDRVGFAPTMEQIAGLAWVTGLPDGLPVAPRGACDPLAGTHAAFALLAALEFTERTGRGQLVEVPMIESVLNVTAVQTMEYETFGAILERRGNRGSPGVKPVQWFATQDAATVVESLVETGIPAAVVISPSLVIDNPQLVHRGFFEPLTHPSSGPGLYPCPPFARPDGTDTWLRRTPPTLGQHTGEVLTELCGLTDTDLERLADEGVIGTRPKGL
jgi:crotonobetainyl-CoA:carnitine CoA-transferase CaiB-like acyl-CoA transferase